jgi:hypothetical protein
MGIRLKADAFMGGHEKISVLHWQMTISAFRTRCIIKLQKRQLPVKISIKETFNTYQHLSR